MKKRFCCHFLGRARGEKRAYLCSLSAGWICVRYELKYNVRASVEKIHLAPAYLKARRYELAEEKAGRERPRRDNTRTRSDDL